MISTATGRVRLWAKHLSVVLALILVAAACGDSDDGASSPAEPAATAVAPDAAEAAEPDEAGATGSSETTAVEEEQPGDRAEPEPTAGAEPEPSAEPGSEPSGGEEPDDPTVGGDEAGAGSDQVAAADDAALTPQRIVSISPTATEMAFAIAAGDRVVAVDQFSYYPEEAPVTDLDGWNPNIEAIAAYDPDLVLMQTSGDVGASLEALGIEVWAHDAPLAFDDVYIQIESLGAVTGRGDEAAALVADMQARIDDLIAAAPDASGLTYYHELDNTLYTVTSSTFIGQVYGLFGLANVADPADADGSAWGYPQLSDEYLVDADPDVIFLADTVCCGQNAQTVAARPGWDQLTAVQTGRIVELNDDIASRWGPRLVDFIAAISDVLVSVGAAS